MADSGGHWKNLAEAQKLTQSELLSGVVDESPKRGGLMESLPVRQAKGKDTQWNRSSARRSATRITIGDELVWSDNVDYDQKTMTLKQFYDQTPLNKFVRDVYNSINDYEAQQLLELRTGVIETLEDALIYDDEDYNALQLQGLHHWAVDGTGTDTDIDEGEGPLSLMNMRKVNDAGRYGWDLILMPFALRRQISAFYQEAGHSAPSLLGSFVWDRDEQGKPVAFWDGIRIQASDYMLAEQANTGVGSDARAKNTSGTNMYSIFFIKMGQASFSMNDPGVIFHFGGDTHSEGEVFRPERFPTLEGYDAAGLRLVSYAGQSAGSIMSVGRIYDITDTPVTA